MMLSEPRSWDYVPPKDGRDVYDWIIDGCRKEDIEAAITPFDLSQFIDKPQPDQDEEFEGGKAHFWSSPEKGLVWESYKKDDETGDFKKSLTSIGNHLTAIAYVNNVDKNDRGVRHGLGIIIAGRLIDKTFEGDHKSIRGVQKDVFFFTRFFINGVGSKNAFGNESQVFTNVPVFIVKFPLLVIFGLY
jgi:hypothetical protein